jgi:hypothetical protein
VAVLKPALEAKGCREGTSKIVARITLSLLWTRAFSVTAQLTINRAKNALELRLSARDSPIGAAGKP